MLVVGTSDKGPLSIGQRLYFPCYFTLELERVNKVYADKVKEGKGTDKDKFELSWEIQELSNLVNELTTIQPTISVMVEKLKSAQFSLQKDNVPCQLGSIRDSLVRIISSISRFKRSAATHMFVVMISSELRNRKPYALPVQCLPCTGLKESDIRRIVKEVVKAMVDRNMKVCGT